MKPENYQGELVYLGACKVSRRSMHMARSCVRGKFFVANTHVREILTSGSEACSTRSLAVTWLTVYRQLQVPTQCGSAPTWFGNFVGLDHLRS